MTFLAYGVCGVALLLSLGVLLLAGMLVSTLLHGSPGAAEFGIAAVAGVVGLAQVAAPGWLLWKVAQGSFAAWGAGLGVASLVASGVLGGLMYAATSAAAQP